MSPLPPPAKGTVKSPDVDMYSTGVWDHGWPKMLNLVRTKVSVLLRRISVTAKELVS